MLGVPFTLQVRFPEEFWKSYWEPLRMPQLSGRKGVTMTQPPLLPVESALPARNGMVWGHSPGAAP